MAPKIELDIRPIILFLLDSKLVLKSELGVLHMTDDFFDENNDEEQESFASLLDSYSPSTNRELRVGDKVVGKIISIGKDAVFVDTGTKIDGVVDKTELLDENGELPLKDGDEIELFIVTLTEDEIKLSKAISGIGGLYMLQEAHAKAVPVEGRVLETCKGGFRVEILQRKAFCPISQIDVEYVENPVDYVGAKHQFLITQFEENGRNIVVSRRILLAQELAAARKLFYESVSVGQVLAGKVTRLMPYGAFVEISAGVEGMVHISELSWSKLKHPDEAVAIGDSLQVKIIGLEQPENSEQLKVALSAKQLLEDPWLSAGEHFQEGHKVQGKVTRCAPFGAFVEIAPGIEGLVHISEMSYLRRIIKPEEIVTEGESVSVLIKEIDLQKRRISLSIRDAEGDPWLEVPEKFKAGQSTEGTVEKKEKFGYFINLSPGVTGLLPKSNFKRSSEPGAIEKLREGDRLPVLVEMVNLKERKITLAPGDAAHEKDWQKYSGDTGSALGDLGEKLQQALASKKKT
jgi:small subunit ribosomal protein S1